MTWAQVTGVVLTGIANVHCALQLKINFQVPPSVAGFKSILGLFIPIHVYGLVCPLSLSGPAGFLQYLPPSLRSYLLPSGEQHKNESEQWMKAILPAQDEKLCFWPRFPKMLVVNGKKVDSIIRIHLRKAWCLHLSSCPEISTNLQSSLNKNVVQFKAC